jgi:hypothetical protein
VASFLKDSLHNTVPTSTGTFKLCNKKWRPNHIHPERSLLT